MSNKKLWIVVAFLTVLAVATFYNLYLSNEVVVANNRARVAVPAQPEAVVLVGGDVMLGRSVNAKSVRNNDFTWFSEGLKEVFGEADWRLVNLENPIVQNCPTTDEGMIFCGNKRMLEGLNEIGVDVVGLENNHTRNYGSDGLTQTKDLLTEAGIGWADRSTMMVKKAEGVNFGVIAYDDVSARLDTEAISRQIKKLKSKVDVLLVMVHWGAEYQAEAGKRQIELAEVLVESGADVVLGSHPHWVQNVQLIDGKPVFYSLGNLIFDQMWSEETRRGVLVKLNFKGKKLENWELIETQIYDYGRATIVQDL